jgi:hypothetical protein
MDFLDLFFNGKSSGPCPQRVDRAAWLGSIMDQGGMDKRARWRLAGMWCASARAHRCSPVAVEEDEPDVAAERWRDGGKERWRLEHGARVKEGVRELRREGKKGW